MKTIHITSQDELPDVAEAVIEALGRRTVVALRGEMGAGKTTLIREIAAQLGATDTVTSPTFAIVNQYKGKGNRRIHHFDFYRINDIREAYDFGYEEYFFSGDLCLVEWPEKIEQLLPENVMTVLQELCRQLQHPEADIFIHVDAKSDIRDFAPLRPLARFIHPRSKVYWGEYGQIDCMLKLLRATCNGDYRYIAILSGDTLPLRPCGQIHDFLEACYPRQFADMQPELHITELTQKMQWCHYPDRNDWIGRLPGYFRKRLYKRLRPGDNPYFRTLPPLEKGSNWIVVTDRFRDFVFDYLRTHPDYIRAFRHSHCGDEIFFQTLMGISEFAGANTRRPLVFTRWVGEGAPHPETFGTNDLPRLLQARDTAAEVPYLFARKIADDLDIARYRAAFFPRPE